MSFTGDPQEPIVSFDGKTVDLAQIPDNSISMETYKNTDIRGNSAGLTALIPKFSNDVLVYTIKTNILPNCERHSDVVYDGALHRHYLPELLERMEQLEKENKLLQSYVDYTDSRAQKFFNQES